MSFLETFLLHTQWSVQFSLAHPWQLAVALIVNLLIATLYSRGLVGSQWQPRFRWVFVQFLFFPALTLVGVLGQYAHPRYEEGTQSFWIAIAYITIIGMLLAALSFGVYWVVQLKDYRWFAISLLLFNLWLMWNAGFIAGMAITADWI